MPADSPVLTHDTTERPSKRASHRLASHRGLVSGIVRRLGIALAPWPGGGDVVVVVVAANCNFMRVYVRASIPQFIYRYCDGGM